MTVLIEYIFKQRGSYESSNHGVLVSFFKPNWLSPHTLMLKAELPEP